MTDSTGSIEEEINAEIGYELPEAIAKYTELDPELFRAYRAYRSALLDDGISSRKDKLLMAIAILAATKQGDAMDMYASIARNEGASGAEVRDALRVGVLFAGGPAIAASAETAVKYGGD